MPHELSIFGVLVPGMLLIFILAMMVLWGIDWLAGRFGLYRYVWHPSLFRLALFVCVLSLLALLIH